jgi:hypothetical protein
MPVGPKEVAARPREFRREAAASPDLALHCILEPVRLPRRTASLELAEREPRLLAQRARAACRTEARVGKKAVPCIDEEVDIALDQAGVDPVEVGCLDRPALMYDVGDHGHEAINIALARIYPPLVTVTSHDETGARYGRREPHRRGTLAPHDRTICERRRAVHDVAAHFKRSC